MIIKNDGVKVTMIHDRYCVGRFQLLDSTQAALSRPARKWIEPIVQQPLTSAIVNDFTGIWYDADGYYIVSKEELNAPAILFLKRLCDDFGCIIIDCLGRVTSGIVD